VAHELITRHPAEVVCRKLRQVRLHWLRTVQ
jgi:hypothetical protein